MVLLSDNSDNDSQQFASFIVGLKLSNTWIKLGITMTNLIISYQ